MDVRDANFITTKALPNGAATVYSDPFDLGAQSGRQKFLANCELKISAPAIALALLADTKTMTYSVECHDDADFGVPRKLGDAILVQTGVTGTDPCLAASVRFRLPTDVQQFVRVSATNNHTGNCSVVSMTVELLF